MLPTTMEDLRPSKTVNLVTAPSSFLLLLVSAVACLPPTLLLIRSPTGPRQDAARAVVLFKYQLVSSFCLTVLVPAMTIGSSSHFRSDVGKLRNAASRKFNSWNCIVPPPSTAQNGVYTLSTTNRSTNPP